MTANGASATPHATYMTDQLGPLPFCPGCGHHVVTKALDKALVKLQLDPRQVVIVTDIGCIGLADRYFTTNVAVEGSSVQTDLAGERRVRVRRARKPNPSHGTEGRTKCGAITQVPGDVVIVDLQTTAAGVFVNPVVADLEEERAPAPLTEAEIRQRETLNKALRLAIPRKPRGPNLNRHSAWMQGASAAAGVHEQITKPPRAAAIGQAKPQEPDLIAAAGGQGREDLIQIGHADRIHRRSTHLAPSSSDAGVTFAAMPHDMTFREFRVIRREPALESIGLVIIRVCCRRFVV